MDENRIEKTEGSGEETHLMSIPLIWGTMFILYN